MPLSALQRRDRRARRNADGTTQAAGSRRSAGRRSRAASRRRSIACEPRRRTGRVCAAVPGGARRVANGTSGSAACRPVACRPGVSSTGLERRTATARGTRQKATAGG